MARRPKAKDYQGPTLRDVADAANVSEMTASRVIRNVGYVADATRDRVQRVARDMGYVPNLIAGGLASNRVNLVGVVIPSMRNVVFPEVLSGISHTLHETPLQPVFGVSDYQADIEEEVIRNMLSWRPSGLILAGLEHNDAARTMLHNAGIPIVEVMDTDGNPIDMNVGISHRDVGVEMAKQLIQKGYRYFGYAGGRVDSDLRALKRRDGFADTVEEAGLPRPVALHYQERSSLAQGRALTAALLEQNSSLDCIYYSSDVLTAGGLLECLDRGLDVPNDIALAGFNGLDLMEGTPLQLATTRSPRYQIGQKAAEMLLQALEGKLPDDQRTHAFIPEIFAGETI